MKGMLSAALFVLLCCSIAFAGEWQVEFNENFIDRGIDPAVKDALHRGADPIAIVRQAEGLAGIDAQKLVRALYCNGVKGEDIRAAAGDNQISETIVVAGYKESLAECRDAVMRGRGYPITREFPGGRRASAGGGGHIYGSPSTFQ